MISFYRSFAKIHRSITVTLKWCRCHHSLQQGTGKCSKRFALLLSMASAGLAARSTLKRTLLELSETFPQMILTWRYCDSNWMKSCDCAWRWTFCVNRNWNKERSNSESPSLLYLYKKEVVHWKYTVFRKHLIRMPSGSFLLCPHSLTISLITWFIPSRNGCKVGLSSLSWWQGALLFL